MAAVFIIFFLQFRKNRDHLQLRFHFSASLSNVSKSYGSMKVIFFISYMLVPDCVSLAKELQIDLQLSISL
ncbi:hypothetical protein QW060_01665 [Myroides ceti]|uniref:Uncharacterized protein n=1 Tax=Paenimyroides ceti TaxID=395087 RepID=A0ABT8CNE9_9FLAO|nr:hypothetical protein [Paenimyroides ceti]MDN3705830.1 hypothetical protein [Paenimyroides ceti]